MNLIALALHLLPFAHAMIVIGLGLAWFLYRRERATLAKSRDDWRRRYFRTFHD